jgi:HAMP domain-containing protein
MNRPTSHRLLVLAFCVLVVSCGCEQEPASPLRLGATALAGLLALGFWLAFNFLLTQRVERLVRTAERLAQGDLSARSRLAGSDELARLSQAFDIMAERTSLTQKRLTHDITERKRNELSLYRKQRYQDLVTSVSTSFINLPWERLDAEIDNFLAVVRR